MNRKHQSYTKCTCGRLLQRLPHHSHLAVSTHTKPHLQPGVALISHGHLNAVELLRPPLGGEADDAEEEVALDGEALGAGGVVRTNTSALSTGALAGGEGEVVDELGVGGDAGAEVDGAAEYGEGELDAELDVGVDADGGLLGDVGLRGPDGVPAGGGGGGRVDEVEVELGVGEGEAEVGGDGGLGVGLELDADGEAEGGAELDDARDVDEVVGEVLRVVGEVAGVGGGGGDGEAEAGVEDGVDVEGELVDLEGDDGVLEHAGEGHGGGEGGLVGGDGDVGVRGEEGRGGGEGEGVCDVDALVVPGDVTLGGVGDGDVGEDDLRGD